MAENPYTRMAKVTLLELVPERDQLPRCQGWKQNLTQCVNKAKYELSGKPVCAVHIKPSTVFMPEKWLVEA